MLLIFPFLTLSKPHWNKNCKKKKKTKPGKTARLLVQQKGRKRCLVLVSINCTVGLRAGKLPSNYYRIFITSGSFFPAALMNPAEMGNSERQIPYAISSQHRLWCGWQMQPSSILIHFCSCQHAKVGSAPKIRAGRKKHRSLVVLKALHLFHCCAVIFPPEWWAN